MATAAPRAGPDGHDPGDAQGRGPDALPVFGGRYRARDILKSARGVTTYRGVDERDGAPVVLKATDLRAVPQGTELLLRHEAAALGRIKSPYVAPLLEVGVEDGLLYVATPLVEGVTLRHRLAAGPLSVDDALSLGMALVTALAEVFDHGVLHRDLRPANVIVNEGSPLARATLVDFGFSRSESLARTLRDVPLDTARYASPEQAGLLGHDVDERSDLYSLGVVLFEALAGGPPFEGPTVGDVLRQHLTSAVPSLRDRGVAVPRVLDELVHRLLAKDPKDRYQTASAVLRDLAQIAQARARGVTEPHVVIGAHDRRCCVLAEPAFVGRAGELARLEEGLPAVVGGAFVLAAVEAESGGGKTRLLEEFAHRAAEQGAWVLRGQGVDQTAQRPFQALQGIAETVVAAASDDPRVAARLRAAVGDHRAAACAALPALAEVLGNDADDAGLGPEVYGPDRTVAALAALLDALGRPDRPAVVLVDDCQWADQLTVRLLDRWRRAPARNRRGNVLVVAAFRSEEVAAPHPLRELPADTHLSLAPLDDDDVRDLAESMAGALAPEAATTVVDLAEGSPFMASAILHGLVESGALVCRHPGWEVDAEALADVQSSSRAATFLARRLELLPREALVLLSAGAVLGKEFDLELAAHLAGQDPSDAVRARNDARRRHLVWNVGGGGRVAFVHDKIREALLGRLRDDARRELHAAAAARIEAADPGRTFELAYHYDAAGRHDRALPYALAAAEQARAQHAVEIAEEQYRIAARARHLDRHTDLRVAGGLGDVTMLLGRYGEARAHLERALELAEGPLARSSLEARLSEVAFKHGDLEASASASERGLRLLGRRVPSRAVGFLLSALWEIAAQAAHTLFPRRLVGRRPLDHRAEPDLLAARHYSRLAHVYWFTRGPVPTLWGHLRELNFAERYEPGRELAQAYSEHAPAMTLVPWFSRGLDYVGRSHRIRRDLDDVWGQAQSLSFTGIVLFAAGRYDEVIERCHEAVRLFERTGDRWELHIARLHLAFALYRQGRLGEAVQVARRTLDEGLRIGDLQASGLAVEIWSKASGGRVPEAVVAAELARRTPDVQLRAEVMQGEAVRLLRERRFEDAVAVLDDARARARDAAIRNEYVAPLPAWSATALREWVESLPPYAPERRALLRRARRAARVARRAARSYRNNRPHALREAGLVAALCGRRRRARRLLGRSVTTAAAAGMVAEEARSLLAFAEVGRTCGWPGADDAYDAGARRLETIERGLETALGPEAGSVETPVTLSLVDRFDTLLDQGRRLAAGLSRDAVVSAVQQAALRLLRAEQCTVVEVDGALHHAPAGDDASPSLVGRAVAAGHPVVADETEGDAPSFDASGGDTSGGDTSGGRAPVGVRSALCAPIFERGRVTACFVATHRGIAGLFGDDEVRLAAFVASLAGAALENARGFAEVEGLQRSLEHRVAERTGQLTTTLHELERLNDQLREANQTKSDFVSMVSHELRTPLTPIVGLSSTLINRWGSMDEATRTECLTSIYRQGVRLARLVDDLLEMSRIEAGTLDADPRNVEVAEVVRHALDGFAEGLADVEVECPEGLAMMADPDRLQQILVNYLENARKYGEAPYRIEVRARGPWVELAVCDTGEGVPEEFAAKLFEKFTRAPAASKEPGTGLGLSIVRGLARAQGGEAWYERNEPRGARFCVRLPRATASPRQPAGRR